MRLGLPGIEQGDWHADNGGIFSDLGKKFQDILELHAAKGPRRRVLGEIKDSEWESGWMRQGRVETEIHRAPGPRAEIGDRA